jgi:hypothetical protein
MLAQSYLHLRRWEEAENAARKVLAADPHNPMAFLILARLQLHRQDAGAAVNSALEPMDLIIVSGLPRSGTSLMMQMLQAGGLPLMTDGRRGADLDNPGGYWEWEEVKKSGENPRIIEQAQGKVVAEYQTNLANLINDLN